MKKSTRILATVLALTVMSGLFTACNNQNDDRIDPTTRTTESNDNRGYSEPNQSIAESVVTTETESSETATTAQSGAYTYEAYGYQFTMNVNIDDYIFASAIDGTPCFNLYGLAEAYGWTPHRADGNTGYDINDATSVMWYEYSIGDGKIMGISCGCNGTEGNPTGRQQLTSISYNFVTAGNSPISGNCYEDRLSNPLHEDVSISVPNHASSGDWYALFGCDTQGALTREDAIILAYLISVGPQHVGENPMYYADFYNADFRTGTKYVLPY